MTVSATTGGDTWLLSFYRASELAGATFFGRLARLVPAGPIQRDMTRQFADEAQHAWLWSDCMDRMGIAPCAVTGVYQDHYLQAVGVPANLMEALAITRVFERRVIRQYARHAHLPGTHPEVRRTLSAIMNDERWHIRWIGEALAGLQTEYGRDAIRATLRRYRAADEAVYARVTREHAERLRHLSAAVDAPRPQPQKE
jgi:hypothetical protein